MDFNAKHSINLILNDPNITQNQYNKIIEYSNWWKNLWYQYAIEKQKILNGLEGELNIEIVKYCPYTIWDISNP